jgi:hypothetical protein
MWKTTNYFQVQDTIPAAKTDIVPISNTELNTELKIEKNTIEMVSLRVFTEDTARLNQPVKVRPIIKTIPLVPEYDTVAHPTFNVLEGNFVFPDTATFFEPFYFTPFDPVVSGNEVARIKVPKGQPQLEANKIETLKPVEKKSKSRDQIDSSIGFQSTDWMLGIIIFALIIFGWLRVGFARYFQNAIQASYNYFTARRIFEEANVTRSRVFNFMNLLFFVNLALFLTQYLEYNRITIFEINGFLLFLLSLASIILLYLVKSLVLYALDFIFSAQNRFSSYVFTVFIFNKILGFLLLPIVSILPYMPGHITPLLFNVGFLLIVLLYVFRLFKGLQLCFKNRLSIFYLILYLCALEILPMLILFKLVFLYI